MIKYTNEELELINSLNKPIINIDMDLVKSIVNKMTTNKEYESLINFFNLLNDFSEIGDYFENFVERVIKDDNKECISVFLDNEDILYFLNDIEKKETY